IAFGVGFIGASVGKKDNMMAYSPFIPLNVHIDDAPFHFEIEFETSIDKTKYSVNYGFSFDWIKDKSSSGKQIRSEFLKVKDALDSKFQLHINREFDDANYLSSPTGRCNKKIKIKSD